MQFKNLVAVFMVCVFFLPFGSAYLGTYSQDSCVNIKVLSNCSTVTLSQVETKSSEYIINTAMQNIGGQTFNYSFCNTSEIGQYKYSWDESCADCSGGLCGNDFGVTPNGEETGLSHSLINVFLILFLIGVGVGFYMVNKDIDYDRWNNQAIAKYQNRNYVKLVLSSIWINVMKNPYVIYYLLGLPVIILTMAMANTYALNSLIDIMKVILIVYSVGIIIVGIYFVSNIQEWFMDLLEQIKDMDWGIER